MARSSVCLLWLALLTLGVPTASAQYFPPPDLSGGWRRLVAANTTPTSSQKQDIRTAAGLDWDILKQAWDASAQYGGSFLVIRNGWIAAEWGTTTTVIGMASCTKTVTALTMQRLFDMSATGSFATTIGPDDLAFQYLPPSWGSHPIRQAISIRHLLTMSSGLEPDDSPPAPANGTTEYEQKLVDPPVRTTPGSEWSYASLPVDTLTLVAEQVSGSRLGDFFQQQIGDKIGVTKMRWGALGTHTYASAYGRTTARDLARIAYLLLRRGTWSGESIVSAERIDEMTRWDSILSGSVYGPQIKFPTDPESQLRYGQLVWTNGTTSPYVGSGVPSDAYYCAGLRTNFAVVIPSLDLIFIRLQNGPAPWSDALFTYTTAKMIEAVVTGQANVPPTAQLSAPTDGTSFTAPASITVAANASDSDGTVTQVAFLANGNSIGVGTDPPYQISWQDVPAGSYILTARSTDDDGASTTSAAISVTVVAESANTYDYAVAPNALAFGSQPLQVYSTAQNVTVENTGTLDLPINSVGLSGLNPGEFSMTNTCGTSLPVGGFCTISVRFKPTSTGTKTASLDVAGGGGAGTTTVTLEGTGAPAVVSVSPTMLSFGNVASGTSSTKSVTISNSGSVALPISSISLSGKSAGQFSVTHTCGGLVAVGDSCMVNVTFTPTSKGSKSAKLTVACGGGAAKKSISLSGTGT